jgi:type IV pilus assembly protein PilC
MAEFICRLGAPTGEVVTRTIEAGAERELRAKLEREGFRIFSISSTGSLSVRRALGKEASGPSKIKIEDFLLFNQQLSALLRAGLPILQAIGILRKRVPNEQLKFILTDVEEKVRSGMALSEAFAAQGEAFPRIYIASILAGERAGALDEVLLRYVSYQKTVTEARRKIKKSLTYPAVLITASMILIMLLSTYVIPKFMQLYSGQAESLPLVTVIVVGVANFISTNLLWMLPTVIILAVAIFIWRRSPSGRYTVDSWTLKAPIAGETIRMLTTAQFTRSLATLLAGGITLPESVEIAGESITNRALRQASEGVLTGIREGRPFTDSLADAGWISELALDMIGVGERAGALREMLDEVANFYDAEVEVRLNTITTFIEPAILIFMGGLVMTILLAMYLPVFYMIGNIGNK